MDRTVVAVERLEIESDARLLSDEPVRAGADRFLQKIRLPDALIIFCRDHPSAAAHVRGAHQDGEVEKRFVKMEPNGALADDLDVLGSLGENVLPGAAVMLVTPFHVLRSDRRSV